MDSFVCDRCGASARIDDHQKLCEVFLHPDDWRCKMVQLCPDCQKIILREIEDPGEADRE